MSVAFIAVICALLYLAASGVQLLSISQQRGQTSRTVIGLGLAALVGHAIVAYDSVVSDGGLDLGFYKVSALIFLLVNVACLLSLLRRPLQNLLVLLFPCLRCPCWCPPSDPPPAHCPMAPGALA